LLQAIEAWEYLKTAEQLTPAVIRGMHSILMPNQDLQPKNRSSHTSNSVGAAYGYGAAHRLTSLVDSAVGSGVPTPWGFFSLNMIIYSQW
ncbi:MAG: hypothetical protein ACRDIE_08990, partial [Chloroflexota bacterium]